MYYVCMYELLYHPESTSCIHIFHTMPLLLHHDTTVMQPNVLGWSLTHFYLLPRTRTCTPQSSKFSLALLRCSLPQGFLWMLLFFATRFAVTH